MVSCANVTDSLRDELIAIVGETNIATSSDDLEAYGRDWTRFYLPDPAMVVFPKAIEDVLQLVVFANERDLSLVPSGGRTGLSGGAVAREREIVISFDKMNRIHSFDPVDHTVVVEPGVVTANLQAYAKEHDLAYPVDFASAGSSQIGGNIATNAGGIKVLRYGLTRDQVAGLKVVTGKGELLNLNQGLIKNATGYDLRHLFIGSEGTLGLIVEATIRLSPPPPDLCVLLLAVPGMDSVMRVFDRFRRKASLTAFEFFSDQAMDHVLSHLNTSAPFTDRSDYYVLLELEEASLEGAMTAFEDCLGDGTVIDGIVSQSEQQRIDLWRYREGISESITPHTPYKNDLAVRISRVPEFLAAVSATVSTRYPDFELIWFGHIGDGNLHLNILRPDDWSIDSFKAECDRVSDDVMAVVAQFEGSVSAEHGVGLLKREQLHYTRSAEEIEMMRGLKQVFDPNNVMNPGKLLPLHS